MILKSPGRFLTSNTKRYADNILEVLVKKLLQRTTRQTAE